MITSVPLENKAPGVQVNKWWYVVAGLILLAVILCTAYFVYAKNKMSAAEYQAVFLDNGQVYFGKVADSDDEYVKLNEIFYLQANRPLQPENTAQQPDLTLIKLGNELHGPTDEMNINRNHVLFIENLKSDSKVLQAIRDYKNKK